MWRHSWQAQSPLRCSEQAPPFVQPIMTAHCHILFIFSNINILNIHILNIHILKV